MATLPPLPPLTPTMNGGPTPAPTAPPGMAVRNRAHLANLLRRQSMTPEQNDAFMAGHQSTGYGNGADHPGRTGVMPTVPPGGPAMNGGPTPAPGPAMNGGPTPAGGPAMNGGPTRPPVTIQPTSGPSMEGGPTRRPMLQDFLNKRVVR